MLAVDRKLRELGVLSLNRRNAEFQLVYNRREYYPLVDDKFLTKQLAARFGVSVPRLYAMVEIERQVRDVPAALAKVEDFVIKPASGSQGLGIAVIVGRSGRFYLQADGSQLDDDQLCEHVSHILSGIYSLGGQPDKALIEYRVKFDPVFENVSIRGVPDIRIIVFLGVPVMAMVRLPTVESRGKANLHQGAVGAGIDIASGRTLSGVWHDRLVTRHPDTQHPIDGIQIPGWERLLEIAARSYEMTGLGYQGIDIVLDRELGPMVLELNARPGLAIQLANRAGLARRLEAVLAAQGTLGEVVQRIGFARERFAAPPRAALHS